MWVVMPERVDALALYEQALNDGIGICPGTMFSASGRYRHCFRMSCGMQWSAKFEQAVARLGELARKLAR
jgi:DNA-binding transcriptional MocR family regulator